MKHIFLTITFFFTLTFCSQVQSGTVTYKTTMEPFSEKLLDSVYNAMNKENSTMSKFLKDIFSNRETIIGILEFNNQESLYWLEDVLQNDAKSKLDLTRILAGSDDIYYKSIKDNVSFRQTTSLGDLLLIEIPTKKWKITQESKTIGNYLCYKAIDIASKNTKMKPIVWFTPQIPVSFGPKDFSGLPGLVLQVQMYNFNTIASKIVLNPKEKITIEKPNRGKKMTQKEYLKMAQSFRSSFKKQ